MTEFYSDHAHLKDEYPYSYCCDPPRKCTLLSEEEIITEIETYAPSTTPKVAGCDLSIISFQPSISETYPNEDRYHVETVTLDNHPEKAQANIYIILDGHSSPACSSYAVEHLPPLIKSSILSLPSTSWSSPYSSDDTINKSLSDPILQFDNTLKDDVLSIFPPGVEALESLSDEEITKLINDNSENNAKVKRYGAGSTVLVVLQVGRDVWTANVGDCKATVGYKGTQGGEWDMEIVSGGPHNARSNPEEGKKVIADHEGEEGVIKSDRVLGLIAVTRALGDGMFKLPGIYAARVWAQVEPPFRNRAKLITIKDLSKTPPYLTAIADTKHYQLPSSSAFLIISSDGLENPEYKSDATSQHPEEEMWVKRVGKALDGGEKGNLAARLLRAINGDGEKGRYLSSAMVNMDYKEDHYQDDTTVLVAVLRE